MIKITKEKAKSLFNKGITIAIQSDKDKDHSLDWNNRKTDLQGNPYNLDTIVSNCYAENESLTFFLNDGIWDNSVITGNKAR